MNKIVVIYIGLCIGAYSCTKESIADYISYDKDTINNPLAKNPTTPQVFDTKFLFDKTWTGYSSNDPSVKYTLTFDRNGSLHIASEKNATSVNEVCNWYFNDPDVFVMYPTIMINNQNVKGTWTIKGNDEVLYLSRASGTIELRH